MRFPLFHASARQRAFAVSAVSACALVAAVALQHLLGWQPCPLCVLQRLAFVGMMMLALGAACADRYRAPRVVLQGGATLSALGGCVAAYKQLRLLWGPSATTCGSSLRLAMTRLADRLPWLDWLLDAPAECGADTNRVFGLPLAFWVMVLLLGCIAVLWLRKPSRIV